MPRWIVMLVLMCETVHAADLTVRQLKCEMRTEPLAIASQKPRLSWTIESSRDRTYQSAYQILVASSRGLLDDRKPDLWDSGRVESGESIRVEYAGKPLAANQRAFWTVRVWDRTAAVSNYATPATWTTALLGTGDWQAKWISNEDSAQNPQATMTAAKWIWHGGDDAEKAPPATRHFRRSFALPRDARLDAAELRATADNECVASVNGVEVVRTTQWERLSVVKVGQHLKPGVQNIITVAATNTSDKPNPAGVVARLTAPLDTGEFEIVTDASWESAESTSASDWKPAKVVANWGEGRWQASDEMAGHPPLPLFRKQFNLPSKQLRRALIHISGLGHYKLYLNGEGVGDRFLDPAWSKYQQTVFYNTFDVTSSLKTGGNAIGVMLGRSYYATRGDRRIHAGVFDNPPAVIVQLELQYADGSSERVVTDPSWRWTPGPYVHNSIIGGVDYDARKLPQGWCDAGFDDSTWRPATPSQAKLGALVPAISPPLKTFEEFQPKSITEPKPGHFVYDLAQNAAATVRLKVRGKAGSTLRLTYAEQRHGQSPHRNDGAGLVDQSGIGAPNYIEYTLRGGAEETWLCDLFYTGFQYLQLTGGVPLGTANPDERPVVTELVSLHVRADAPLVGSFDCSNEMYRRIDRMIDWSVRNNLSHVLTDCPHREKLGWLEVPHLMWDSMAYRFDLSSFGPKVSHDIADSQLDDGMIPTVAPSYSSFGGAFGYTPEWGAAGVMIPWYVYEWYGDKRNLEASFPMMRRFVDYMRSTASTDLVPKAGLGDWYDYGHGQALGPSKFTPVELTAMAIFHDCAQKVSRAATVLGRTQEADAYRDLADQIRHSFNTRFYTGNGIYKNNGSCQTANAMALVCGLVEPTEQAAVADAIVADLKSRGFQQTSGDVGFHYLVRALTDFGKSDALFAILNRDTLGSYAYLVNAGWTSLPEAWDADRNSSMNHCMLGHIQEWFNRDLAGIVRQDVAFKRFRIRPTPGPGVTAASASLECPYGRIVSAWKLEAGVITVDATVPVNTTARVEVPGEVIDSGGIKSIATDAGRTIYEVGSGNYRLRAKM